MSCMFVLTLMRAALSLHICPASRCTQLQDNMQRMQEAANEQQAERIKLDAQLTAAVQRLGNKHRLMAEVRCQ